MESSVQQLNARRRRAVELRLEGRSLQQIRAETGLSAPTVIAAHKAFLAGGWSAVAVRGRGRQQGEGRALSAAQEQALRRLVLTQPPEASAPGTPLWQREALGRWVQQELGVALGERTVTRYLERWGLRLCPLQDAADTPATQQWLQETLPQRVRQARQQHAALYWCGELRVGEAGAAPSRLLVALSLRGSLLWLPLASGQPGAQADFLQRLQRAAGGPVLALMHGLDADSPATAALREQLRPLGITLHACPVALRRVTAAAPVASAPPAPLRSAAPRPAAQPGVPPAPRALPPAPPPAILSAPASAAKAAARAPAPWRPATPAAAAPFPSSKPTSSAARAAAAVFPSPKREQPAMKLTHLQRLEAESIHIMREVVAEADKPVMLYSIGKDSAVMLHLAKKAFYPAPPPFPLLHVDTTWKFRDMYAMRERMARELGMELLVYQNPEAKALGINPFDHGSQIHTDMWKTQGLKQALDHYGFDAAFGGARRDEEKSRAKERIFSFRTAQHRWDPKNQRPELWKLYNARKHKGESIRVFPLSNWTELDIWQYIYLENVPIVPLYLAKERPVVERDGTLIMVDDERFPLRPGEMPMMRKVRFRTLGCYPLTGGFESEADTLPAIIQEMLLARTSERQGRMIDHDAAASMEKKKQEGYF
ncbi:sulfate adenylyltransferase subunit CysD [Azohydromonas sp. G-1-1-14]|uniref:Sulfate adenylyltransferase subunit 2 n=2 Tax=Azohydromonas caseinilytica TaxID=2728836 RepID=A0A848FH37_9BURK|nr:sulfate adenylyltransferase subunit CysD [Azohydromonas caseinilytica]